MLLKLRRNKKALKPCRRRRRKIVRSGDFFVYILCCSDGTLYTGYTKDIKARLKMHNAGKGAKYVRGRVPVKCVYSRKYCYYKSAVKEEFRIKSLSRPEKEELIRRARRRHVKDRASSKRRLLP